MRYCRKRLVFLMLIFFWGVPVCLGSGTVGTMTIAIDGNGTTYPKAGNYVIMPQTLIDEAGERTVITAYPATGWQFEEWSETIVGLVDDTLANPTALNIQAGIYTITAVFSPNPGYVDASDDDDDGGGGSGCFIRICR